MLQRWKTRPGSSALLCAATLLCWGCGAEQEQSRGAPGSTGFSAESLTCSARNLTRACSCDTAPGRQLCDGAGWSPCECEGVVGSGSGASSGALAGDFAGNLRDDIHFEWQRTGYSEGTDCPPGDYEGNFQGVYSSALAPGIEVVVINLELATLFEGKSGFHFTIEPAEGGETTQRVTGIMEGTADAAFPIVADIVGELDCAAGTFVAQLLMGQYSVLADGFLPQLFEGVMTARYDHRTTTLVDGIWDVRETSAMPPGQLAPDLPRDFNRDGYGGWGEWSAALPTDLASPDLTACDPAYVCGGGPLGPNKLLCGAPILGPPPCTSDAECDGLFPGEGITCLNASALSICMRECKP